MIEAMSKCGMGALLIASVPVGGDLSAWGQWGLAGLVVGYVLWRDYEREKRMAAAIDAHERWMRTTLLAALEKNSLALERMASRPCLAQEGDRA